MTTPPPERPDLGAFDLDIDPLADEHLFLEVALPIDTRDRAKGCFYATVQDLPDGKEDALRYALGKAWNALSVVYGVEVELAKILEEEKSPQALVVDTMLSQSGAALVQAEARAHAWRHVIVAQREIVRWGVRDHRLRLRHPGTTEPIEVPFESVEITWEGAAHVGAGERMLRLYRRLGLLGQLSDAVLAFQDGKVLRPEQVWAAAEEARRKVLEAAKQKAAEEAKPAAEASPEEASG